MSLREELLSRSADFNLLLLLFQSGFVDFFPVVQVIQIHRVMRGFGIIRDTVARQNGFPRFVDMVISANRAVEFVD
jgi:hypothetical protein